MPIAGYYRLLQATTAYHSLPQPTEVLLAGFRRWRKEFRAGGFFAGERLERCQKGLLVNEFLTVLSLLIGLGKDTGGGNRGQGGWHGGLGQFGIGRRIAVVSLVPNG